MRTVASTLARQCHEAGFDLAASFPIGSYNESVEQHLRLPDFGDPRSLALVLGNTRALWPRFLEAMANDSTLLDDANPIETYTERHVGDAAARLNVPYEIRWAHDIRPSPVAIQRVAEVAGLAAVAPSNLSVHPIYGPWIALRAVVIADVQGPLRQPIPARIPCDDCEHACLAAFRRALGAPDEWRHWLEIRDACPTGRAHRYDEGQIRYHYTKDREALRQSARGPHPTV